MFSFVRADAAKYESTIDGIPSTWEICCPACMSRIAFKENADGDLEAIA